MKIESTSLIALLGIPIVLSLITTLGTFYVQERKLRTDLRTEFMAETAVRRLLQSRKWRRRYFDTIKKTVGGFTDDELRRILVRAGAVRFRTPEEGREVWGLIERNKSVLGGSEGPDPPVQDSDDPPVA